MLLSLRALPWWHCPCLLAVDCCGSVRLQNHLTVSPVPPHVCTAVVRRLERAVPPPKVGQQMQPVEQHNHRGVQVGQRHRPGRQALHERVSKRSMPAPHWQGARLDARFDWGDWAGRPQISAALVAHVCTPCPRLSAVRRLWVWGCACLPRTRSILVPYCMGLTSRRSPAPPPSPAPLPRLCLPACLPAMWPQL